MSQEQKNTNVIDLSAQISEFEKNKWFSVKGTHRYGPFEYREILYMLQKKILFEYDFVWHKGLKTWSRIAELDAFRADIIQQLKKQDGNIQDAFYRRRHKRVKYQGTVLVHDNIKVWKGIGVEISPGGAGVVMENSCLRPGNEIHLHFKPGDGVPSFNAVCEVVSKKFNGQASEQNSEVFYGLKFISIEDKVYKLLKRHSSQNEAA